MEIKNDKKEIKKARKEKAESKKIFEVIQERRQGVFKIMRKDTKNFLPGFYMNKKAAENQAAEMEKLYKGEK